MAVKTTANKLSKRKSIRFKPDPLDHALIDLNLTGRFAPEYIALIAEEAPKGCGLVLLGETKLEVGDVCRVKVGRLAAMKAEVRWRTDLDPTVYKVGLMYLE